MFNQEKEAQIYIDANLKEAEINGRKCLIRSDIDMEQVDKKALPIGKE